MHFPCTDSLSKGARVLPETPKNVGSPQTEYCGGCASSSSSMRSPDFRIEDRWLIDPKALFVGPRIGEGAHAKVYEGKYCNQSVAVKVSQKGKTVDEVAKMEAIFYREVSMLSKVQHKNIVRFIGACKEPAMVVATELLQGGSLRKYLMRIRPKCLDLHVAVGFALDIAHAMDCLHSHGIIHRDLKPENLLMTSDHKSVKLVDMGLAREETLTEMMTAETGTYRWMAPELYSTVTLRQGDKKHYNNKVDVYSFAIVLWELVTNRLPFEGMSNLQAAYAAAFKGVRPSVAERLNLPKDLVAIMECCWAEDPDMRPNFSQVAGMLDTFKEKLASLTLDEESTPPPLQVADRGAEEEFLSSSSVRLKPNDQSQTGTDNPKPRVSRSCFSQCFLLWGANKDLM